MPRFNSGTTRPCCSFTPSPETKGLKGLNQGTRRSTGTSVKSFPTDHEYNSFSATHKALVHYKTLYGRLLAKAISFLVVKNKGTTSKADYTAILYNPMSPWDTNATRGGRSQKQLCCRTPPGRGVPVMNLHGDERHELVSLDFGQLPPNHVRHLVEVTDLAQEETEGDCFPVNKRRDFRLQIRFSSRGRDLRPHRGYRITMKATVCIICSLP